MRLEPAFAAKILQQTAPFLDFQEQNGEFPPS
jgi:hypothetical protein